MLKQKRTTLLDDKIRFIWCCMVKEKFQIVTISPTGTESSPEAENLNLRGVDLID